MQILVNAIVIYHILNINSISSVLMILTAYLFILKYKTSFYRSIQTYCSLNEYWLTFSTHVDTVAVLLCNTFSLKDKTKRFQLHLKNTWSVYRSKQRTKKNPPKKLFKGLKFSKIYISEKLSSKWFSSATVLWNQHCQHNMRMIKLDTKWYQMVMDIPKSLKIYEV